MNTHITFIDENEAKVAFTGYIFVVQDKLPDFNKALVELIEQYAI